MQINMETKEYEYQKLINEIGQIPFVIKFKNLIESAKGDKNENLKFWKALVVEVVMSDKESKLKQYLYIWFMQTYFPDYKEDSKKIRINNSLILDFLDGNKDESELLKRRLLQEYCIEDIIDNKYEDLETLIDDIDDKISIFPNRRSLNIEKHIVTKIEKRIKANENNCFFETDLSDEALLKIMRLLTNMEDGLDKNTNSGLWLYWFNRNSKYTKIEPLKWGGSPTKISNIIQTICKEAKADEIMAAFGVEKVGCSAGTYAKFDFIKNIKQIITIDKQKK
jgi:hypothetical protein